MEILNNITTINKKKILFIVFLCFFSASFSQNSLLWLLKNNKNKNTTYVHDFFSFKTENYYYWPKYKLKKNRFNKTIFYKNKVIFDRSKFIFFQGKDVFIELFNDSILVVSPRKMTDYSPYWLKREYSVLINIKKPEFYYIVFLNGRMFYPWDELTKYNTDVFVKESYAISGIDLINKKFSIIDMNERTIINLKLLKNKNESYQ